MEDDGDPTDPDLIPRGEFCYRVVSMLQDAAEPVQSGEFGQDRREAAFVWNRKRILCPHWRRTDHGTIRCEYLAAEAVIDDDRGESEQRAIRFFGSEKTFARVRVPSIWLTDEIKICGVNLGPDDELDDAAGQP